MLWKEGTIIRAGFVSDLLCSDRGKISKACRHSESICFFVCIKIFLTYFIVPCLNRCAMTLLNTAVKGFGAHQNVFLSPLHSRQLTQLWDKISRFIASSCQLPSLDMAPPCRQRANGASRGARVLVVQKSMSQCPKCAQQGWGTGELDRGPGRWMPKSLSTVECALQHYSNWLQNFPN